MRILFLTSRWPLPPVTGDRIRAFYFLQHLSQKHDVTLVSFVEDEYQKKLLDSAKMKLDVRVVRFHKGVSLAARLARGVFSSLPLQVHYYTQRQMRYAVNKEIASGRYDLVFVHLLRMVEYVDQSLPIPKIIDLTDAISLNYARLLRFSGFYQNRGFRKVYSMEKNRVTRYEDEVLKNFDASVVISKVDRNYLAQRTDVSRLHVVKNGVNLKYFRFFPNGYDPNKIVFHGNMNYLPNVDAALYFYRDVFPRIKKERPAAKLYLVGTAPAKQILDLKKFSDVFVTGRLNDLRPQLRDAAVSICPLRAGAGLQNKVLEAMAIGAPVVTTTVGLEGIDVEPGKHLELADSPEAFAEKVLSFLKEPDKRAEFSRNARQLVERKYTWEKVLRPLDAILEQFNR